MIIRIIREIITGVIATIGLGTTVYSFSGWFSLLVSPILIVGALSLWVSLKVAVILLGAAVAVTSLRKV